MVSSGELSPTPAPAADPQTVAAAPEPDSPQRRFARYCDTHPDAPECRLHEL